MGLQLVVVSGDEYLIPDDSKPSGLYRIREGQMLTMGRGGSTDVRFAGHDATQDLVVARRQTDLELKDGVARIFDYGSLRGEKFRRTIAVNGQYLQGDGTRWVPLAVGDEIRVGDTIFKLESVEDS